MPEGKISTEPPVVTSFE
jgi:hypothetical protein